ncbi:MAG: hypothetical protein OEW34_13745 [Burkholderiaceae bacterium]|jgi:hypothetical protein|nr:hypothetical protein [Burkholderiaceae bacterium]
MTWNRDFLTVIVAIWRQWAAAVAAAGVLGIAGCASVPGGGVLSKDTPLEARQQAVSKRALERWDALLKGDTKTAYGFLSPASREVTSLERFQARTNTASFRAIKLDGTSCDAESCKVKLYLTFDHRAMSGVVVPLEETWVISDGQAWLVYRE